MATRPPEDAIEMLNADHEKVLDLFKQYTTASDEHTKRGIAEEVFFELETHAQLEEQLFYPAFEEEADEEGEKLVEEARKEHQAVKDLIEELRSLATQDKQFDAKFRELMENVEHHIEEEETEMFPQAEEMLAEQVEELRDEMQELKQQLTAL
jgi:iron-sulfur cluster repair protein YtfE (RIC family)